MLLSPQPRDNGEVWIEKCRSTRQFTLQLGLSLAAATYFRQE